MGAALKLLREFLEKIGFELDRRTAASLLFLLLLLILLPIGLFLIKKELVFLPKALGELIQLGEGGCVKFNPAKKKVVDCPAVPLKLINPVSAGTPLPSGSTPASTAPSSSPAASPSTGTPQSVNVKSFNNDIQAALDSIKTSGGSVYLPAGTYAITEKVRIFSNTTLFGDGMGVTIIKFADNVSVDEMMANDSTSGQQNIVIRDLTLAGPDIPRIVDCCHGLKLENLNGGYIINVEVNDVGMDGIYLGYKVRDGAPKGVSNVRISGCKINHSQRQQLGLIMGNNVVIDHCSIDGTNKHGSQVYAGIDLEPDDSTISVTNSYIISNNISNTNIGVALNGANGESRNPATVTNNKVCGNTISAITTAISDSGQNNQISDNVCEIPASLANLPPAPAKPAAKRNSFWAGLVKTVSAQDSDDVFSTGQDSDSNDQFVNTGSDSDDEFRIGSQVQYKLAQSQADLTSAQYKNFPNASFLNTTFQLSDSKPGVKQIWVQFKLPDGTIRIDNITFDLVDNAPQILGLSCNLDISKENLKITIDGQNLGTAVGTAGTVSPAKQIEVLAWNDSQVSGILKKPGIPLEEGQRFKVELTRADGFKSGIAVCAVDKSLVSLGARIFCREPGKFDAQNVSVTLLYSSNESGISKLSKIEEKVTIGADGEINNLKTKLQVDKNYVLSIKAPNSLQRNVLFTAREGTTEISNIDGTPFILPIGDIAPTINPDGQINTLDRAEIIRQWRILGQGDGKQTGDFNRDSKVNSIDWACMRYDFGSSDEPLPVEVPQTASGTIHIPGGQTASPTPNNSARIESSTPL